MSIFDILTLISLPILSPPPPSSMDPAYAHSPNPPPHAPLPQMGQLYPYDMAPPRPRGWTAYYYPDGVLLDATAQRDHLPWWWRLFNPRCCTWCGRHTWRSDYRKMHAREPRDRYPLDLAGQMQWRRGRHLDLVCPLEMMRRERLLCDGMLYML